MIKSILLAMALVSVPSLFAQNPPSVADCSARLEKNLLTLENSKISRTYEWNNGNLITRSLTDKVSGKSWQMTNNHQDLMLPGQTTLGTNASFTAKIIPKTSVAPEHLEAEVVCTLGQLEVKRVFRLYAGCPAIACDFYFRGRSDAVWLQSGMNLADMVNLEKFTPDSAGTAPVIETVDLPGKHWRIDAVEFFDVTDRFNNLVNRVEALSYRPGYYRGNLLLARDGLSDSGIFILKEAPTSNVQLAYPGGDFLTEYGNFKVVGVGLNPSDLDPIEWRRGYGFVTGVFTGSEDAGCLALRNYQKNLRRHLPGRDEMVMMNTWGDRGQDKRIREKFALAELDAGAKLGITHFQLDDGWQTGRSANSAFKGGTFENIYSRTNYWQPDPEKFPNGLEPVMKKGRELGIKISLWFNPSPDNSNQHWEDDADTLIGLHRKYGVDTFKIDGVKMGDKLAEVNYRKMLDKVCRETTNGVVFDLDVTAGRRGGYHYFNEYGNLYVENRYTDWQNYYPCSTLRNLWMLSRFVPPQNLQMEFLNKWRNAKKYGDDPFAPANYSFDFLFAITTPAQSLAFFEGSGLPAEAFAAAGPVIRKYREVQADFHRGDIFPIGDEPSGKSWTGFQSLVDGRGYFLIFRESNDSTRAEIKTWLAEGAKIQCTPVIGKGKSFSATVGKKGAVTFQLADQNSYALYKYSIKL